MEFNYVGVNELKKGRFVMIDNEPCKIVEISVSKPGKHGVAKARIVGIGIFDGKKRVLLANTGEEVAVPIVKKLKGQVISVSGDIATVMNLDTYETFDVLVGEFSLSGGEEVEVIEAAGRRMISKVVG